MSLRPRQQREGARGELEPHFAGPQSRKIITLRGTVRVPSTSNRAIVFARRGAGAILENELLLAAEQGLVRGRKRERGRGTHLRAGTAINGGANARQADERGVQLLLAVREPPARG